MMSEILSTIIICFLALTYIVYICLDIKDWIDNDEKIPERFVWKALMCIGFGVVLSIILPFYFSIKFAKFIFIKLNGERP